jgi:hypothetical protein
MVKLLVNSRVPVIVCFILLAINTDIYAQSFLTQEYPECTYKVNVGCQHQLTFTPKNNPANE